MTCAGCQTRCSYDRKCNKQQCSLFGEDFNASVVVLRRNYDMKTNNCLWIFVYSKLLKKLENYCIGRRERLINDLAPSPEREDIQCWKACAMILSLSLAFPATRATHPLLRLYVSFGCSFFFVHRYYEVVEKLLLSFCLSSLRETFCTTEGFASGCEKGAAGVLPLWMKISLCPFNAVFDDKRVFVA